MSDSRPASGARRAARVICEIRVTRSPAAALAAVLVLALLVANCHAPEDAPHAHGIATTTPAAKAPAGAPASAPKAEAGLAAAGGAPPSAAQVAASAEAWGVIYGVLQHPRCLNCHPVGNAPLQGDDSHPHAQDVRRGADGTGVHGMRCDTCHQERNLDAPHLPPGAPHWHLPRPEMPLVFEGVGPRALAEQMRDPARNGGRTPEQLFEHMSSDALVLWGWDPGPGRAPVSTPHADLVIALRTWIDGGCAAPEH